MKKTVFAVLVSFIVSSNPTNAATNYYCLSGKTRSALEALVVGDTWQIVFTEGKLSHSYSSARGESDHFIVQTLHPDGGRVLRMRPFTTSNFRPWHGVEETNVVFTDIVSGEVFTSSSYTETLPDGKQHRATVTVDNRDIYILVKYSMTPRYPYVIMTWGMSASFGNVGMREDVHQCAPPKEDFPMNSIKSVQSLTDGTGEIGYYLVLIRSLHAGHCLEFSNDRIEWAPIPRTEIMLNQELDRFFWKPKGGGAGGGVGGASKKIFFRLTN